MPLYGQPVPTEHLKLRCDRSFEWRLKPVPCIILWPLNQRIKSLVSSSASLHMQPVFALQSLPEAPIIFSELLIVHHFFFDDFYHLQTFRKMNPSLPVYSVVIQSQARIFSRRVLAALLFVRVLVVAYFYLLNSPVDDIQIWDSCSMQNKEPWLFPCAAPVWRIPFGFFGPHLQSIIFKACSVFFLGEQR